MGGSVLLAIAVECGKGRGSGAGMDGRSELADTADKGGMAGGMA